MAVTPRRLVGPTQLSNATSVLYTVPSSPATKTVVNYIHVSNPTTSAIQLTLSINADGSSTRIYDAASFQPGVTPIFCNHVLEATEFLAGFASDPNLVISIDGDERTL